MTCSESPLLTAAPSHYSTNTMIDIIRSEMLQVIIHKTFLAVRQQIIHTVICPAEIQETPKLIHG